MQTLGLSDTTPRTEGRLKSLFWPALTNGADVDYVTYQGFWLCTIIAVITAVVAAVKGAFWEGLFEVVFFFLCGVGIRRRSVYAAIIALTVYFLATFVMLKFTGQGIGVQRTFATALLLSNVRATWLASKWPASEIEPAPDAGLQSLWDRFADFSSRLVWPIGRYILIVLSVLEMAGITMALLSPAGAL